MENNKDIRGFEKCSCCEISLHEGIGRFRKGDRVFCIKCYKDKTKSYKDSDVEEGARRFPYLSGNTSDNLVEGSN